MGMMSAFGHFLYDPEEKTVMGRTAESWAKVSLFYAVYYTFIFGLGYYFLIGYQNVFMILPEEKSEIVRPNVQTRVATPGIATFPAVEQMDIDSDRVSILSYIDDITGHLLPHAENPQAKKALSKLGMCSPVCQEEDNCVAPLRISYSEGNPCIFYQLNKVIGWKPFPLSNLNGDYIEPRDKSGSFVSQAVGNDFNPQQVYFYCYDLDFQKGYTDKSDRIEEMTYYSSETAEAEGGKPYGTISFRNYPRTNPAAVKELLNPYVAVHVKLNPVYHGELINVGCQVYAGGLSPLEKTNSAFASTSIKVEAAGESSINQISDIYHA